MRVATSMDMSSFNVSNKTKAAALAGMRSAEGDMVKLLNKINEIKSKNSPAAGCKHNTVGG